MFHDDADICPTDAMTRENGRPGNPEDGPFCSTCGWYGCDTECPAFQYEDTPDVCPGCGAEDDQACFADCPQAIAEMEHIDYQLLGYAIG